jgi:hypothetical protein
MTLHRYISVPLPHQDQIMTVYPDKPIIAVSKYKNRLIALSENDFDVSYMSFSLITLDLDLDHLD